MEKPQNDSEKISRLNLIQKEGLRYIFDQRRKGRQAKEIYDELKISEGTFYNRQTKMFDILGVKTWDEIEEVYGDVLKGKRNLKLPDFDLQGVKELAPKVKKNWVPLLMGAVIVLLLAVVIRLLTSNGPQAKPQPTAVVVGSTVTPLPKPTEANILFQDIFDSTEISSKWHLEEGVMPYAYGGKLVTDDFTTISVGDVSWTDYEVTLSISDVGARYGDTNWLGVRGTNLANMMQFLFGPESTQWWERLDGVGKSIDPTIVRTNQTSYDIKVRVLGKNYYAMDYPVYPNPNHPNGKVYLHFFEGEKIDNFTIVDLSSPPSP